MGTAVQHEGSVQDRIVVAARHLFSTRGFHQTAMADLAAEAKVSVGAIYRSFEGKADIIKAIVAADTERWLGELQDFPGRVRSGAVTGEGALTELILWQLSESDETLGLEILAEGHRNPAVAGTIGIFCEQYRAVFRELARLINPALPDEDLDGAEELLLAMMFGLGHRNLSRPRLDEQATARIAARLILKALR